MPLSVSAAPSRRGLFFVAAFALILVVGGIGWYAHATGSVKADPSDASAATTNASGEDILLGLAKTAASEHRLVAPAGSNAYEFYLSVLQLDPHNPMVPDQLSTLFADACNDIERAINARDVDEAQRELSLLRDYDSNNYKLALLGSKLSAQRMVMTREHEVQAAVIQAQSESTR